MRMPPLAGYDPDYERPESELLSRLIRPGTAAVDIGAHTGHYTLLTARYVSSTGKVLAVEPDPTNLVSLCQNVGANGFRHVRVLAAAVSDQPGVAPLYLDGGNGGDNRLRQYPGEDRASLLVSCVRLDDLVGLLTPLPIEFVKIDVQGNEMQVLRGGGEFLGRQADLMLLVEYAPFDLRMADAEPGALVDALFDLGFTVLFPDPATGQWVALGRGDRPLSGPGQERGVLNLLCLRGSYRRFVR